MKLKRFQGVNMAWFDEEVVNAAKKILRDVSKEVAIDVMEDAKRILKQKATTTTERGLLAQFDLVESKFKDGGFLVWCQGPRKWWPPYHASFMEMGTYKDQAKPFLRVSAHRNKRKAYKKYQDGIDQLWKEPKWVEPEGDYLDKLMWD